MTRYLVAISCLLTWFCSTHAADGANLRTWTSESGKYTVKAELLSFAEGVVTLRRADGEKIEIPIAKLSQGDQKHVLAVGRRKVDPVKALVKLGAEVRRNERGEVIMLILSRNKKVTDAELVHLEGLINLQSLILWGTQVSDAGLVHLKGLTKLEAISLAETKITDAGLIHLRGLVNLQQLYLDRTQITNAAVAELKKSLPNCMVHH
tara:strand:+ start:394 stop:1014 length:621 start_codon:yes stop_codon:yes gene_type:complete